MRKTEILNQLDTAYHHMAKVAHEVKSKDFYDSINGKWSAAENLRHLTVSAKIVNKAFRAPKLALALKFGLKLGKSMTYKDLVKAYQSATRTGFEPRFKSNSTKEKELEEFLIVHNQLSENIYNWSDGQLNRYQVKHPALGKVSMREIAYFMIYHIGHHTKPLLS